MATKSDITINRPSNIIIDSYYSCPWSTKPPSTVVAQAPYNSGERSITITSGRRPRSRYAGTMCNHVTAVRNLCDVSQSNLRAITCTDPLPPYGLSKGAYVQTVEGNIAVSAGPHLTNTSGSRLSRLIVDKMREIERTGLQPKPPNSVNLGESLGEISLSAHRLTETLLNLSSPTPRPPGRSDLWTPEELNSFKSWKDTIHPLEFLFGLWPVADQTAAIAFQFQDVADAYKLRQERWIKRISSHKRFKATILEDEIKQSWNLNLNVSGLYGAKEIERTTIERVYLTGYISCRDTTSLFISGDALNYIYEAWPIVLWDLTNYSYLFDRLNPFVKNLLRASIQASNTTTASGGARNSTIMKVDGVQVHHKRYTNSIHNGFAVGKKSGQANAKATLYTRTWPDEAGAVSETFNLADVIADFFDDGIKPINGWLPRQYVDLLCLFVPTVIITS